MTPYKKKDIIPIVSNKTGIDEDSVKEVVDFFWSETSKSIREMRHLNIFIHELGEFRFAKSKLEDIIERNKKYLSQLEEGTNQYINVKTKLERLELLVELRDAEYQKRAETTKRKDEYKSENKKGLEE